MPDEKRVLLIGDPMIDINYYCKVRDVVCREAPIPILDIESMDERPGGASNVKANLEAMGLAVEFIPTSTVSRKRRIWVGDRLVCRYDEDGRPSGFVDTKQHVMLLNKYSAIVVSDYQKSIMKDYSVNQEIFNVIGKGIPVFVDTKAEHPESLYRGANYIFPNEIEWPKVEPHVKDFGHIIRKDGANGCFADGFHVPSPTLHGADPTGAGDTFLAAFVVAYLDIVAPLFKKIYCGDDIAEGLRHCARYANLAAAVACSKRGTVVVSSQDVASLELSIQSSE